MSVLLYKSMMSLPLEKLQEAYIDLVEYHINSHDEWDHEYAEEWVKPIEDLAKKPAKKSAKK